jgi:predicted ATP-grasp superfamily ATP-dependent carboligase
MRIGCFQLHEPVPELHEPYVLACLRPWIDVNGVGSLVLNEVEARLGAVELGALWRPGRFYDFTRYRPVIHIEDGIRDFSIPNTPVHYAKREGQGQSDVVLLRLLEPHAHAELYVDSVLKLFKAFGAKKYVLLGSMHDMVPHTRPLLVSGYGMGKEARKDVKKAGALPVMHHGPSTIVNLVQKKAAEAGIDTVVFIVSLPQYVALEEDYLGKVRLMEVLNMLYDIPVDREDFEKALEQRRLIGQKVDDSPAVKGLLPELERAYDLRVKAAVTEGMPQMTSEMEEIFWGILGKDIGKA